MVRSIRHQPYTDRLRHLKLPSLYYRRLRGDMIMTYQIVHAGVDLNPALFFDPARAAQTRGHPWKLDKPRAVSRVRRNAFSVRVVDRWNSLPLSVVSAPTVNTFKNRLDNHWTALHYEIPSEDR